MYALNNEVCTEHEVKVVSEKLYKLLSSNFMSHWILTISFKISTLLFKTWPALSAVGHSITHCVKTNIVIVF